MVLPLGVMVDQQLGETATLLRNGEVPGLWQVVSNWGGHGITRATAELYDPATGQVGADRRRLHEAPTRAQRRRARGRTTSSCSGRPNGLPAICIMISCRTRPQVSGSETGRMVTAREQTRRPRSWATVESSWPAGIHCPPAGRRGSQRTSLRTTSVKREFSDRRHDRSSTGAHGDVAAGRPRPRGRWGVLRP